MAFKGAPNSIALPLYFAFWYAFNIKCNEYNTRSLDGVGGKNCGMTMIVTTAQLAVCALYALTIWCLRTNPAKIFGLQQPSRQTFPNIRVADVFATLPLGFCSAGAHACTVYAQSGDPLFGHIVKSGEPVIATLVNLLFYSKAISTYKILCLPVIVGGVAFASFKKDVDSGEFKLKFDQTALVFGMLANTFAAFRGSENKKLMSKKNVAERFGDVGNQFAVAQVIAFFTCLLVMYATEGEMLPVFAEKFNSDPSLRFNLVASGLCFYLYNELATMTLKVTGVVTASVASTAKRVIVMVYMAAITGKQLTDEQKLGAGIAISGVLAYSLIDELVKRKKGYHKD